MIVLQEKEGDEGVGEGVARAEVGVVGEVVEVAM
jgi:hypothetical protein